MDTGRVPALQLTWAPSVLVGLPESGKRALHTLHLPLLRILSDPFSFHRVSVLVTKPMEDTHSTSPQSQKTVEKQHPYLTRRRLLMPGSRPRLPALVLSLAEEELTQEMMGSLGKEGTSPQRSDLQQGGKKHRCQSISAVEQFFSPDTVGSHWINSVLSQLKQRQAQTSHVWRLKGNHVEYQGGRAGGTNQVALLPVWPFMSLSACPLRCSTVVQQLCDLRKCPLRPGPASVVLQGHNSTHFLSQGPVTKLQENSCLWKRLGHSSCEHT
ncbi:hypothetical protein H920_01014 [Fukomys damarensis]|uniref:Uncharacterized protein n=1 Tax=Fukomys damarensis TaxID=885580 RepID=A0A091DZH7_FUKDA|nr:hypothetical protein H920_01014 [Fukomys damarensis]